MYYVRYRHNLLLFWLVLRVACVLDRITRLTRFDFYSFSFKKKQPKKILWLFMGDDSELYWARTSDPYPVKVVL